MRILYAGHQATEQMAEDQQKGVDPHQRKGLSEFDQKLKSGEFDQNAKKPGGPGGPANPRAGR